MIWGCMTSRGVGYMCKIDNGLDGDLYRQILAGEMLDTLEYYDIDCCGAVFQHDNDPKHTAKATLKWLDDNHITVFALASAVSGS